MAARRIAIIPARGGSKRIKDKNIALFCGRPLIAYSLTAARESGLFEVIHVSTEDERIRKVVEELGCPADFLRDPALADDHTPVIPVLQWVLRRYQERGRAFDDVCILFASAPLIDAADLRQAHDAYRRHDCRRPLLAVAPYPVPVEWAFEKDEQGGLTPCQPGKGAVRSQDLRKRYYDTGTFAFFPAARLLNGPPLTDQEFVGHILPKDKAVDIDEPEDFDLAEALFLGRRTRAMSREPSLVR